MQPVVSVARTVKLKLPTVVGVPVNAPLDASDNPAGSAPLEMLNAYDPPPPVAVTVWLYAVPVTPAGSEAGLTVMFGHSGLLTTTV